MKIGSVGDVRGTKKEIDKICPTLAANGNPAGSYLTTCKYNEGSYNEENDCFLASGPDRCLQWIWHTVNNMRMDNINYTTYGGYGQCEAKNNTRNIWGDENCNRWVNNSPTLCDGSNYQQNCAKKCAERICGAIKEKSECKSKCSWRWGAYGRCEIGDESLTNFDDDFCNLLDCTTDASKKHCAKKCTEVACSTIGNAADCKSESKCMWRRDVAYYPEAHPFSIRQCNDTYRESKGNGYEYSTKQEAKNACEASELRLCAKHEIIDKDLCSYGWTSDADVGYPMAHGIAWYDHRANHKDPNIQKTKYWCGGRKDGWRDGGLRKAKAFCCAEGPERKEHRFIEGRISHNDTNYADNTRLFVKMCDNNLSFEWFWKHKYQKQNIDCAHEDGILVCDIDQRYGVQQGMKPYYNTFRMNGPRSGVWGRNGIIEGRLTLDEDLY